MAAIRTLLRWLEVPINLLLWLGLIAGFLMMMHVGADVTGRTFFNHPLQGTTEIVGGWYMVAIAFMPWAWIEVRNNHIVAGMFEQFGGPKFNFWLNVFVKISTLIFMGLFVWQTWVAALAQTRAGEVWEAAGDFILIWPARWVLPISGAFMGLYMALRLIVDLVDDRPR
jgi:TRAP-type C4-dicarboxylate transport system permease small subunit